MEPTGFSTDWSGPSAVHAEPLPAYAEYREQVQEMRKQRLGTPGDPEATGPAILKVVDADEPPLRVFFGVGLLDQIKAEYGKRIETWEQWDDVAVAAHGLKEEWPSELRVRQHRRRGRRRHRPERQARRRHRRRVRDRHPDGPSARERRARRSRSPSATRTRRRRSRPRSAPTCAGSTSRTCRRSRRSCASWDGPLHLLVNNAGIMATPELQLSPEGFELQFATNHLGHFALAVGLHGALAADGARIVSVSSRAHLRSPVVFDDINFAFRDYEPFLGYGQSKTANVLFAVGATQRWARDGIYANALMPGGIATNLQRHMDPGYIDRVVSSGEIQLKTPEQGAATSVYVATRGRAGGRRRALLRGLRRVRGRRPAREPGRRALRAGPEPTPTACGSSRPPRSGANSRCDPSHPAERCLIRRSAGTLDVCPAS